MTASFWIPGQPIGKARARVCRDWRTGKTRGVTPAKTRAWETMAVLVMRREWAGREPILSPVRVYIEAVFSPPKRVAKLCETTSSIPHTVKPDADNICKACLDSLVKARVIEDDSRAYFINIHKHYTSPASPESGVNITIDYQGA